MKLLPIFLSVLSISISAIADMITNETVNGINWTFTIVEDQAETYVSLGGWDSTAIHAIDQSTAGSLVIPPELCGLPVKKIARYAFDGCANIRSVTIPFGVTWIGADSFRGCTSLTEVNFPSSVEAIEGAFQGIPITSAIMPGVVWIGGRAFSKKDFIRSDPSSLRHISIGEKVQFIGHCAFTGATKLENKDFVIPASVQELYASAFSVDYCFGKENSYQNTGVAGCIFDTIFFKGNLPIIHECGYQTGVTSYSTGRYINTSFQNATIICVEGREGWEDYVSSKKFYEAKSIQYGAALASISADGAARSGKFILSSSESEITLNCVNSGAVIHYTTDGSEPTAASPVYSSPIPAGKFTLKANAVVSGYPYTVTESCDFALGQADMPNISAADGSVFFFSGNTVSLATETDGAEIRYTLDGSDPTSDSALYVEPFTINDTTTVKAKAFKADWFDSDIAEATFTREWHVVDTPVISPNGGEFANASQEVSISCGTEGATIYYTTDGSDPFENRRTYRSAFAVFESCVVRAVAKKNDWRNSEEAVATFTRENELSGAVNMFGYTMETSGNCPWTVDADMSHDGASSAKSGGDESYLQTSVKGAGQLSFWWRAMCEAPDEEDYYDYGALKVGSAYVAYLAGEDTGWVYFSTNIATTGKHVIRWEYHKDEATDFAPDCIWIDQVQWVPTDGSGMTFTSPERVPYSWLSLQGLDEVYDDYETAANATAANIVNKVWECYVAGISPTNAAAAFRAVISWENGAPEISWEPILTPEEAAKRTYRKYGKKSLTDPNEDWTEINGDEASYNFFKVSVEMTK